MTSSKTVSKSFFIYRDGVASSHRRRSKALEMRANWREKWWRFRESKDNRVNCLQAVLQGTSQHIQTLVLVTRWNFKITRFQKPVLRNKILCFSQEKGSRHGFYPEGCLWLWYHVPKYGLPPAQEVPERQDSAKDENSSKRPSASHSDQNVKKLKDMFNLDRYLSVIMLADRCI